MSAGWDCVFAALTEFAGPRLLLRLQIGGKAQPIEDEVDEVYRFVSDVPPQNLQIVVMLEWIGALGTRLHRGRRPIGKELIRVPHGLSDLAGFERG